MAVPDDVGHDDAHLHPASDPVDGVADAAHRARRPAWLTRLVLVVVAAVVTFVVVRLVGQVDWAAVWDALSLLAWWHPFVLAAVLLVRMVLNAYPLSVFIPGVSVYRATVNDLAAHLMAVVAPPPSDVALRVSMFTSWDVPTAKGLAGTVMNTVTFYIVRFATPLLGFVLLGFSSLDAGPRYLEIGFVLASAVMLGTVFMIMRSESLASRTGHAAAEVAGHLKKGIDADAWAQRCMDFREDMTSLFWRGFPRSVLGILGMLVADFTIIVLSLRFVGLDPTELGLLDIAIAYLFAYPLTLFPFMGLGIVDALLLAALVEAGGTEVEAAGIAGLVVWRIFTIGGPVALGAGAVALWRREVSASGSAEAGGNP